MTGARGAGLLRLSAVFLLVPTTYASGVRAGGTTAPIVDGFAVAGDFFGKKSIELYLFSRELDPSVKKALASERFLGKKKIEEKTGAAPVLNLMFFFDPGVAGCSLLKLLSYTAVFQKSADFPFDSPETSPVNFSIAGGNHGISALACRFETGAPVRIKVRRSWDADRVMFPTLLPPGRQRMVFTWDVDFTGKVIRGR